MAARATLVAKPLVRKKIRVRDRDAQVHLDERLRRFATFVYLVRDSKIIIIFQSFSRVAHLLARERRFLRARFTEVTAIFFFAWFEVRFRDFRSIDNTRIRE